MNRMRGMKIKLNGDWYYRVLRFALVFGIGVVGVVIGAKFTEDYYNEHYFMLPQDGWRCWVSAIEDLKKEKVCLIYRSNDADFSGLPKPKNRIDKKSWMIDDVPSPGHRKHNKEQGASIHSKQQTMSSGAWR